MVRRFTVQMRQLGCDLALRVAFSRVALPSAARVAYVDRVIVDVKTTLATLDAPADREALIQSAESLEPLLKVRRGTFRRALGSGPDCWSPVAPMQMGRLTSLAARAVLWMWHPPGSARLALVERFIAQLNLRLAVLHDAADREPLIDEADTQFGPVLGLPPGTLRRRLTASPD